MKFPVLVATLCILSGSQASAAQVECQNRGERKNINGQCVECIHYPTRTSKPDRNIWARRASVPCEQIRTCRPRDPNCESDVSGKSYR